MEDSSVSCAGKSLAAPTKKETMEDEDAKRGFKLSPPFALAVRPARRET
jgi:hypothetical protein